VVVVYSADEKVYLGPFHYQGNDSTYTGDDLWEPTDLKTYHLYESYSKELKDTIATTKMNVHGPFPLSRNSMPMFKGFQFTCEAITGTTPTMAAAYCLAASAEIGDTSWVGFTYFDTIAAAGCTQWVDLSSKAGNFIYIIIDNYDDSESHILGDCYVTFKGSETYNISR